MGAVLLGGFAREAGGEPGKQAAGAIVFEKKARQ
jgi:hypothetical protein